MYSNVGMLIEFPMQSNIVLDLFIGSGRKNQEILLNVDFCEERCSLGDESAYENYNMVGNPYWMIKGLLDDEEIIG